VRTERVVLFNPQSSATRTPVLPMSLLSVGAVLEGRYPYQIVDGNLTIDAVSALDDAIGQDASRVVLGVTVMPGPQLEQAVPVCRELKRHHPELTVVWAGYFPSQHWPECLRSDFVDYVVRGHGELVFRELLDALTNGGDLGGVKGLARRDDAGQPVSNPPAQLPHPDDMPAWNIDAVSFESYLRRTFLGQRTVGYASSYGCPFRCNFCAVVNMVGGRWLAQSAERVAAAVTDIHHRFEVDAVEMVDNNFFVHEARAVEFADRIRGLGVAWWGEGRVDTLLDYDDASWRSMRDSGLKMVFLGAESASSETLERMDKGGHLRPEMTLELVEKLAEWDIIPELSFVLGNPPDPDVDADQTMRFIRHIKEINPATEIIMYLYTPVPLEGDLYHEARSKGFAFPETLDDWISRDWLDFVQRRSNTMPWIGRSLQQRIRDFERVLNAYHPTTTMVGLTRPRRALLRALSWWRYHTGLHAWPLELQAANKLLRYQRPETSGF